MTCHIGLGLSWNVSYRSRIGRSFHGTRSWDPIGIQWTGEDPFPPDRRPHNNLLAKLFECLSPGLLFYLLFVRLTVAVVHTVSTLDTTHNCKVSFRVRAHWTTSSELHTDKIDHKSDTHCFIDRRLTPDRKLIEVHLYQLSQTTGVKPLDIDNTPTAPSCRV